MATSKVSIAADAACLPHLAPREHTLLSLLNVGLSNVQIAGRLGLTRGGAATAVGRLFIKLGGGRRYEVVARARNVGIIPTPRDGGLQPPRRERPTHVHLSPREKSVLALMNRGLRNAAIAQHLRVVRSTADKYVARIGLKLGGGRRFEVIQVARELSLVASFKHVGPRAPALARADVPNLTHRERDILEFVNRGFTDAQIAKTIGITPRTVSGYVNVISAKLQGKSRYGAVCKARELHLVRRPIDGGLHQIGFTKLQRRSLLLAAQHFTNERIAKRLGHPNDSVSSALEAVRKKLHVETTEEAIDRAVDLDLLNIAKPAEAKHPFSPRDCDVLEGLFAGLMHREIAAELEMSMGNVGDRVARMRSRLRVRNTEELLDEVERLELYRPRAPRKPLVKREVLTKRNPPSYGITALTPRQTDVIEALVRRPDTQLTALASELGISRNTLQGHLGKIRQRMGVRLSRDVAAEAHKLGLVRSRGR